jgi:hypothetical protein
LLASVAEAGDLAYTTYSAVTVYGLDRYGNQILGNENEADGLIVKLQTACDKPAVLFYFIWESDNTIPGTFSTVVSPNYGGPVTVSVLYNAEHAMGGQACRSPKTTLNSVFLRFLYDPHILTEYSSEPLGIPIENRY